MMDSMTPEQVLDMLTKPELIRALLKQFEYVTELREEIDRLQQFETDQIHREEGCQCVGDEVV